jgi:CelD/BcsL family acetyltransferase involved in cellulose biosynthesis
VCAVRVDPSADARWTALVDTCPDALAFHHPAWLALLHRTYGYRYQGLAVEDGSGALVAGLPLARVESRLTGRRLVALPFSDLCPPLVAPGAGPEAAEELVDAIAAEHRETGLAVEVRAPLPALEGATAAPPFLHHRLALGGDPDELVRTTARPAARRAIAKALRAGVVVDRAVDRAALDAFYALHLRTRRRQGVPTQSKRFVRGFEALFADGLGFVLLARHEGRVTAAAVFLATGRTLIYKYGASDPRGLAVRPNNLLFMEAIRWGCAHGMAWLDFGRTDADNEGLAKFKRSWGAEERSLTYTVLGGHAQRGEGNAQRALSAIIRRAPPIAGRAIGAVLYRHVG